MIKLLDACRIPVKNTKEHKTANVTIESLFWRNITVTIGKVYCNDPKFAETTEREIAENVNSVKGITVNVLNIRTPKHVL